PNTTPASRPPQASGWRLARRALTDGCGRLRTSPGRRPFSQSDTMKPAARQMTYSRGGRLSRSGQVARPMCRSIADATMARVDCRCEIASQGKRDCRATSCDVDGARGGARHAGGDPRAADRVRGRRAWSPVPRFVAAVVETDAFDE